MTVTFYKLSIVGAVLVLLAGCSLNSKLPFTGQWTAKHSNAKANMEKTAMSGACVPEAGTPFHFRKVVLVAGTIAIPELARDLPGLARLTSQRLQTHLDASERFNVFATHNSSFESNASGTAARVKQLGREYGSQFVIKLELEDLTIHSSSGWLPKVLGGNAKRHVLMRLYIYGTEYGALFHSQQYEATVSGNVIGYPGNSHSVTTPWFKTDLGRRIDGMLKEMSTQINEKLACVPFSTTVTAIRDNNVHINAGFLHGIRPGATLRVYQSRDLLRPVGTQIQQENEGWIKVKTVFPNHSIASANQDLVRSNRLDIGDVVRAW